VSTTTLAGVLPIGVPLAFNASLALLAGCFEGDDRRTRSAPQAP
jgi:hypothetical protein